MSGISTTLYEQRKRRRDAMKDLLKKYRKELTGMNSNGADPGQHLASTDRMGMKMRIIQKL